MPDWSYQTLFRPLLFQLPAARARALTLGALHALGQHRLGPALFTLVGQAAPAASLSRTHLGVDFPSPIGLSADLPNNALALGMLARLGVGFIEIGPVALTAQPASAAVERRVAEQAIWLPEQSSQLDAAALRASLARAAPATVPLGVRLSHAPGIDAAQAAQERAQLLTQLAGQAAFFTLTPPPLDGPDAWSDAGWRTHVSVLQTHAQAAGAPLLVGITPDSDAATLERTLAPALDLGLAGVVVAGGIADPAGGRLLGRPARTATLATVRRIRARWGAELTLLAAGGAHEPGDALELLAAGASLVTLDSGMVYAGPGLPKRTNEALRFQAERTAPPLDWRRAGWPWLLLLGLGMLLGGALAWLIAATRVVLPYDEAFVGLSRAQLAALNPRLLPFMAHDRVTLAGTMLSIGVLYAQLALHAVRFGAEWARRAIAVSATVGFLSFFLFLGFGYFDPLHALVALLLLPLLLLGLRGRADAPPAVPAPDLRNDRAWRLAQWGQLGFIALGLGLIGAGLTIALVGITQVFVPEDLAFLRTTPAALHTASARLVALVAHDRAGFGGALVSDGLAVLLLALWGVRRGARWVWWTLLAAGLPGFGAAIGVHLAVGYLDLWHLFPALLAVAVFAAALALLSPYLLARPPAQRRSAMP